ncbi:MAG TPA: hypothetical protein VK212_08545 [Lentimicrobium sp.]|nr:hypothetical protein [Lentimicrobium sp.]
MTNLNRRLLKIVVAALISFIPFIFLWLWAEPLAIILLWSFLFPFCTSILSGILRGILFKRWETLQFAFRIFGGNFIFEEDNSLFKGIFTIVRRVVWEQPQTMIGNFGMHVLNTVWLLKKIDVWKHCLVCQGVFLNGGGIALGSFIMIDLQDSPVVNIFPMDERTVPEKVLIRHEYGHALQSISSGPLFIFKYGIPSILMQGWTEPDADLRSDRQLIISEQYMPLFSNYKHQKMPISPGWWEFAVFPLLMAAGWVVNGINGLIGGILFSMVLLTLINLKRPA